MAETTHAVSFSNSSLLPSARDLLLAFPRLAQRAGTFALYLPEAMDNMAGRMFSGGSVIADATAQQTVNSTITNTSSAFAQSTMLAVETAMKEVWRDGGGGGATSTFFGMLGDAFTKLKHLGGFFSYLTSRWALTTFTVVSVFSSCGE